MASTKFKMIISISVFADFTEVEKGNAKPPWVEIDKVDFASLATFLEGFNRCGENVRVRSADDYADQVTQHFRYLGKNPASAALHDFGEVMLTLVKPRHDVIPVRTAWASLHQMKDRVMAPPPTMLFFVVEGSFESVALWCRQLSMSFGIKGPEMLLLSGKEPTGDDYEGKLPSALKEHLEAEFGFPFKPVVFMNQLANSGLPEWARR